ncbi:MAG: metallophosphoesterase, partial [Dethiobacteria bacterium]
MKTWKILIIPAVVLASVIFFRVQTGWLQTSEFVISSPKVPEAFDGFKILQLSDLHSARFGDNNNALLRRIDAAKPDIIVMTGDMLNSQRDRGEVILDLVSRLTGAYPVYYISGNHEQIAA